MSGSNAFSLLHPRVAQWCDEKLGTPTLPQELSFAHGLARRDHLIVSPTGTGKTLAAFLPAISALAARRDREELFSKTFVIYVSPLRALGYDVEHNVRRPLREMDLLERPNTPRPALLRGRLRELGLRTGVRTGDTPTDERRLMLSRPPHILLTTPESLALMVALPSYRKTLNLVETVIIDEVHALANSKRGVQLSLVLESLAEIVEPRSFLRVGLSATVAPLPLVAQFLVGPQRPYEIVDARALRAISLRVEAVTTGAIAGMPRIAARAAELADAATTTLIFTNVRSQAERLAHEMEAIMGAPENETTPVEMAHELKSNERRNRRIGVHHSSLERSLRHQLEARLRSGALRTVVCSASLELGVDIGFIDRVLLIGGARGMTSTLQRVGRSGHRPGAIAQGCILAQDRDDLLEAAATIRGIQNLEIDEIVVPRAPLDVLAQWIVSCVVPARRTLVRDLLHAAQRTLSFADITETDLRACIDYLQGGGVAGSPAHVRRVGFEVETDIVFGLGREASSAFYENVGTIPDERTVSVNAKGSRVGKLDESFVSGLRKGDVFLLDGRTMRVVEIGERELRVEAHTGRPTVPVWSSHLKGISPQLARHIGRLRRDIAERLDDGMAVPWLQKEYGLDVLEAQILAAYVGQQAALSLVPDGERCVIECYTMDKKSTLIFHTCAGRRVNEVLARVAAARVHAKVGSDCRLTTDDAGFMLILDRKHDFADDVLVDLMSATHFDADLQTGLRGSHLLRRHFRYVANTGLLVLRRADGRNVGRRSNWNAGAIFERLADTEPDFPLVRETWRTVQHDLLDVDGARAYVANAGSALITHPVAATPFSFGILSSSFGDAVHLADRESIIEALHARVLDLTKAPAAPAQ